MTSIKACYVENKVLSGQTKEHAMAPHAINKSIKKRITIDIFRNEIFGRNKFQRICELKRRFMSIIEFEQLVKEFRSL